MEGRGEERETAEKEREEGREEGEKGGREEDKESEGGRVIDIFKPAMVSISLCIAQD